MGGCGVVSLFTSSFSTNRRNNGSLADCADKSNYAFICDGHEAIPFNRPIKQKHDRQGSYHSIFYDGALIVFACFFFNLICTRAINESMSSRGIASV